MTERIIQMHWRCRHCGLVGPGLQGEDEGLRCSGCGSQKSDESWIMPSDTAAAPTVTDPALLKRAKAGANWSCRFCGSEERALHGGCSACGANKNEPTGSAEPSRDAPSVAEDTPSAPVSPLAELSRFRPNRTQAIVASFIAACGLFAWLMFWLFAAHHDVAAVTSMHWKHVEVVEEIHTKNGSGWASNMPFDAFDKSCDRRLKGHRDCDPYKCNAHQVSYQCNCTGGDSYSCNCREVCTSNNNGSASCRKSCSTCRTPRSCQTCWRTEYDTCYKRCPVYEDHCEYKYREWNAIGTQQLSGSTHETKWPQMKYTPPGQRVQRSQDYEIAIKSTSDADRKWELSPRSENEFNAYRIGSKHEVEWTYAGTVKVLRPAP